MSYKLTAAVVGFKWSTLVLVGFRWKTAALGYRRRTTVVGLKWKTLVLSRLQQVNNHSGGLQMKNGGGFPRRTTVVGLKWRTTSIRLYTENNSGWPQMENVSGERFAAGE